MAKKKQVTAKVEERKSVRNRCDYERVNGKCGRALCENFGKSCTGRSCEDWKCEAEGEEPKPEVEAVSDGDEATNCEFNRAPYGYCMNRKSKHYSNSCHKCKAFKEKCDAEDGHDGEGAVATQAVAVVAPSSKLQAQSYKARVSGQYAAIETAKDNLLRECVKFGALLTEVGYYLGESRGGKHDGGGLQTWLEENCPEVNYKTAMGYKALATKCVKMLGGGSQAVAVLQDKTEVIPPGEDAPIEVESKFIEKRDNLFSEVKSRRELEQTYFKFMAHEGKGRQGGANKGQSGTGRRALTVEEQAKGAADEMREMIGSLFAYVVEQKKVMQLTAEEQDEFIGSLKRIAKNAEEMVG